MPFKHLLSATQASETFGERVPSDADLKRFGKEVVVPGVSEEIDDIRALPAPEGDEQQVNEILDAAEQAVEEIEQDPSLVAGRANPFAEANRLAREHGLKQCD